ncbi:hypothetical protein ACB092_05G120500 [Castanea dentata]
MVKCYNGIYAVNSAGVSISHLLFADDTILFCEASREQLLSIRLVLSCFQVFTGLKVNVGKSEIAPVGEVNNIDALANVLQCRVGKLPMKYLGMPLGSSFKSPLIWNPILEKMEKRLSGWKRLYLSKGGRLMLIKSTLSCLPTYFLSLFTIPKAVAARLENVQRKFLWGSSEGGFKYPLVAWDKVCLPIEMGGLGLRKVVSFNQALLGKWLWRFGHEDTHLWRRVISSKYGEGQGGWRSRACRRSHGCGLWRSINEGWENYSKHLSFVVGDGTRIRFWHDRWIGDATLKVLYPELYECSAVKDACISEVLWIPEGGTVRVWNLTFYRAFEDWELAASYSLLRLIQTRIPQGNRRDTLYWRLKGDGMFDVRSYYLAIRGVLSSWLPWKGDGESVNHLLLHCPVTHALWSCMLQAFGIPWVMPGSVADLICCWYQWHGKDKSVIWNLVPGCLMWIVWLERNRRSFEDKEKALIELILLCQRSLLEWSRCWGFTNCSSISMFMSSLSLSL